MIRMKASFLTELHSLPAGPQKKADKVITALERQRGRYPDAIKLKGYRDLYRVRIGKYRLIYEKSRDQVLAHCIRPRATVYKSLELVEEEQLDHLDAEFDDLLDTSLPAERGVNRSEEDLPKQLTPQFLGAWNIPEPYHSALAHCRTETDLLETCLKGVPYPVFSSLIAALYPSNLQRLQADATYRLPSKEERKRLAAGELTSFLLVLDDEQTRLAERSLDTARGPILVKGGPGSGKSTIALHRIKKILEREHQKLADAPVRILFATYTKALTNANKELLNSLLGTGKHTVEVTTVDAVAYRVVRKCGSLPVERLSEDHAATLKFFREAKASVSLPKSLQAFQEGYLIEELFQVIEAQGLLTEEDYLRNKRLGRKTKLPKAARQALWSIYEHFLERMLAARMQTWDGLRTEAYGYVRNGIYEEKYDYVVIDEAQDLTPSGLRLMVELCKHPSALYLTADADQALYKSGFSWRKVHADLNVSGRTYVLRRNYRNTQEISAAVDDIQQQMRGERQEAHRPGAKRGHKPKVILTTPNTEVAQLKQHLKAVCKDTKQPLTNVAVLLAGDQKSAHTRGRQLAQALKNTGLSANYFATKDLRLDARCIKVMSLYASKGLEFPVVVLWDVNDGLLPRRVEHLPEAERREEESRDRRLFYVGASRVMQSLAVLADRDKVSRFVTELSPDVWELPTWDEAVLKAA